MTDLQKKIESLQAQLDEQAAEDEELQKLTENRIFAVQEKINAATESEVVPEQVARLLDDVSTRLESIERQVSTRPQSTLPDYEVEGALPGPNRNRDPLDRIGLSRRVRRHRGSDRLRRAAGNASFRH